MKINLLILFAFVLILESCNYTMVNIPVIVSPKVNLKQFDVLVVGDVDDKSSWGRKSIDVRVESELKAKLIALNQKEILDKNYLMYAPTSKIENQKIALITGEVLYSKIRNESTTKDSIKEKNGSIKIKYNYSATAYVQISFNLLDINTGKILYFNTFDNSTKINTEYAQGERLNINEDFYLNLCRSNIIDQFLREILPYLSSESVKYLTYESYFDQGINFAKNGLFDVSVEYFDNIIPQLRSNEIKAKAYYNMGLSLFYSSKVAEAYIAFKNAELLYHDNLYVTWLQKCRLYEAQRSFD